MNKALLNSRNVGNHVLWVALLIIILATVFSMFTQYSNYIIYPIWALWLLFIPTMTIKLAKKEIHFVWISFFFLGIICTYKLIGYSSMPILELLVNINWILSGVIAIYALNFFSRRELSTIYYILVIALLTLLFVLIKKGESFLSIDQNDAAAVANAWYGSMYVLLSGLSLIVFLNVRRWTVRIMALLVLLLTLYLNFAILQRGTNVIFTLAEISLILIFVIKRRSLIISFFVIITGFVVFMISASSDILISFADKLAEISPSERISSRFYQISLALAYEDIAASGGSLSARSELMGISWNTFTSSIGHFLLGAGEHAGSNTIIGHHSFILDTLARYGLLGGVILFLYFKNQYQIIMSYLDRNREWALYMQCSIVFLFYLMRNYYGQVAYSLVNFVILLLFPLTFQLIRSYNIIKPV